MRLLLSTLLLLLSTQFLFGQEQADSLTANFNLGEIVVYEQYPVRDSREEKKLQELEEDMEVVYPLVKIVRSEYERVNNELSLYQGDKEKAFLKWYEAYAKENYFHYLSLLNYRQGRLFLKLISRELDNTPYDIIKQYRNGFRAFLWQGAARIFFANLKIEYKKDENPMIEYLMKKMDARDAVPAYTSSLFLK